MTPDMNELIPLGTAFIGGLALASAFWMWYASPAPKQWQLMEQNIALTILTEAACRRLGEDELRETQQEASEKMEEAFGKEASVDLIEGKGR